MNRQFKEGLGLLLAKATEQTPTIKFVHDLRNYMVHRALPDTELFLEMRQDPARPEGGLEMSAGYASAQAP